MAWAPDYVTTAELRTFVRIDGNVDDTVLDFAIAGASRAIDDHCNRQFGQVAAAEERLYTPYRDRRPKRRRPRWIVPIDDLITLTDLAVSVDETGATISTFDLRPANAPDKSEPYTELILDSRSGVVLYGDDDEIAVTAIWGWTAVPEAIKQATLLQASRIFSRRTSPFGVAGSPDLGSELRLLAKVDPDVAVVLEPFRREWSAV